MIGNRMMHPHHAVVFCLLLLWAETGNHLLTQKGVVQYIYDE